MTQVGIDARLLHYRTGGISTYTRSLVQALAQINTEACLTVFHSRKDSQRLTEEFAQGRLWTPAHHRLERLALSVEVGWRGLDVWHSPDFIPPYRAARRHIITVHDLTFLHYPQYLTPDSRRYYNDQIEVACRHADHILAVSEATKRDLIQMLAVPDEKISVQPHGVAAQFRPLDRVDVQPVLDTLQLPERYLLHVGTWEPRKNILGLAQAYKALLMQMPAAPPLVLVGRPGWLFDETRAEIDALALGERILWRDSVSDAQLPAVYNAAVALVMPSFYEGFGMPALEAMACGTLPIVSNRSSLPEVVGEVGLLIDPDDPQTMTTALALALTDSIWLSGQVHSALEQAQRFTWQRSAQIALEAYTSLV